MLTTGRISFNFLICTMSIGLFALHAPRTAICAAQLKPEWMPEWMKGQLYQKPNHSYLKDYIYQENGLEEKPLIEDIFDSEYAGSQRKSLENLLSEYEKKERRGEINTSEKREHYNQLATQPKKIFEDIQEQQKGKKLNDLAKRLARFSKRYSFIKTLKKPAALLAGMCAFLFRGQPVKLNVFKDSELEIKSDLSKQKGEFSLSSPILTGSAKFVGKAPKERNPWLPEPDDALQKEERFAIGVARSIPLIDVKGTINYGTTTSNFTATFEKPLSSKISCALDIKRNFNYLNSEQKNSDETVRLMYNLNF